ncbi:MULTISPECIES: LPP20 family lipoprotein [unclassified Oleiphilus]|uniref:LPP20 family lipoprotein n=1 Tax=unclassified Oleiphilus TaxID=2631174 RepID=UPI0009EF6939|nr:MULTISPECIES: LPP20 family lipoprotein [unclassified Oleiphilus]
MSRYRYFSFMIVALAFLWPFPLLAESEEEGVEAKPPVTLQATGYAFYQATEDGKADPKRLLAIRASKLDAYRNLAERVYGLSLAGSSSVTDFELQSDSYSTQIETVIRGARVVSIVENEKTGIETVLELSLPGNFIDCINNVNSFKASADCIRPIPEAGSPSRVSRAPMSRQYHLN